MGSFGDNLKNSLAHALLYISEFDTYYIENITYLPFVIVAEQGKFPLVLGIWINPGEYFALNDVRQQD